MQTLRRGAIEEILRNLNRQFLTRQHFDASFNSPDGTLVHLVLPDFPDYSFRIVQRGNPSTWHTVEAPGKLFVGTETTEHHQRYEAAIGALYAWIDRVCDEIRYLASEPGDEGPLQRLRAEVAEAASELPNPEEPFTSDEINEWMSKLKSLISKIQSLEDSQEIQQYRVDQVIRELEELKAQGTSIPKRTWLKTAGNKVLDLMEAATKEVVKKLATEGAEFLLEYIKSGQPPS